MVKTLPDHSPCIVASSDSRLIFYIAGYVARKCILKTGCETCLNLLLMTKEAAGNLRLAEFTLMKDNGGLLYPAAPLYQFMVNLEKDFTTCFSALELHADSVLDALNVVKARRQRELGCPEHSESLTAELTAFYITTRLHFFTKSVNKCNERRRQASKYIKLSRCT